MKTKNKEILNKKYLEMIGEVWANNETLNLEMRPPGRSPLHAWNCNIVERITPGELI